MADINGRAVNLVKPDFPETAVAAGADGDTVVIEVIVDENGNVISAECLSPCNSFLKDAAELAARSSKFKPLEVKGRTVGYQGTLIYSFVVTRVNWFAFGVALESTRQFDNISLGPVAGMLSSEFDSEKATLLALDANGGADYDTRQKGITDVERSIKSKLKGEYLWRFELSMAMRRVTFWFHAAHIDRREMQSSIEKLAPYIASAPEGTSRQLLENLTTFSKYRITDEISDRALVQAIFRMESKILGRKK